jgi:hypothetical protein
MIPTFAKPTSNTIDHFRMSGTKFRKSNRRNGPGNTTPPSVIPSDADHRGAGKMAQQKFTFP